MTPQERKLVDELFERLATLESAPRDADAVDAINDGLQRAPNALYPMVQTVLVQEEALRRVNTRIRELEAELGIASAGDEPSGSFLDGMRDTLFGKRPPQGSVPTVRPAAAGAGGDAAGDAWRDASRDASADAPKDAWGRPVSLPQGVGRAAEAPGRPGGTSFLGTAAAAAAGVIGGTLLMNGMRDMFGGQQGKQQSALDGGSGGSPWSSPPRDGSLAQDAGLGDIGSGRAAAADDAGQRAGAFDVAHNDADGFDDDFDDGFDFGDTA